MGAAIWDESMIDPAAYAKDTEHSQQVALMMHLANLASASNKISGRIFTLYDGAIKQEWRRDHIHHYFKLLFAIPLGGDRDAKVGADLKAEGVKAGVPDLFLPVTVYRPGSVLGASHWPGLWIEMKRPATATQRAGTVSPQQAKWHADLIGQGYACKVCYTWLEAVETLWKYLNGKLEQSNAQ